MTARWRRRLGRKLCFACALLGTLLALGYALENWRAARVWATQRRALASRGETLDFATFEGPPVPPTQNLATMPVFTRWGPYTVDPATGRAVFPPQAPTKLFGDLPGAQLGLARDFPGTERFDLSAWQRFYRSRDPHAPPLDPAGTVLRALEPFSPLFDELAAARDAMPTGRFRREYNLDASAGTYGSVVAELRVNFTLLLRANASLAAHRFPEALRDLELAFWLRRATCDQPPVVMPLMISGGLLWGDCIVIKHGLDSGGWTDDEITRLQAELQGIDLLAEYTHAMRGELAHTLAAIDRHPAGVLVAPGNAWKDRFLDLTYRAGPRGWIDRNKLGLCRWYQDGPLRACAVDAHRIHPEQMAEADRAVVMRHLWDVPTIYLASTSVFFLNSQLNYVAEIQAQTDELIITCALKRYALAHDGHYPAALAELTPQFLARVPSSVFDGNPPRYHLQPDGKYQLAIVRPAEG